MILKYYGGYQNHVSLYQNIMLLQKKMKKRVNLLLMKVGVQNIYNIKSKSYFNSVYFL